MLQIIKNKLLSSGHPLSRFPSPPPTDFYCILCGMVVREPMECIRCFRLFCTTCLVYRNRTENSKTIECPNCPKSRPHKPSQILIRIINELEVYCLNRENGCAEILALGKIANHESVCEYRKVKCDNMEYCRNEGLAKDYIKARFSFISLEGLVCSKRCENLLKFISEVSKGKLLECLELYYLCLNGV